MVHASQRAVACLRMGIGDVNPPVHAWAAWRVYKIDQKNNNGKGDIAFLESVFHKLLLNFTWWVNRKDAEGNNIFQGGFFRAWIILVSLTAVPHCQPADILNRQMAQAGWRCIH